MTLDWQMCDQAKAYAPKIAQMDGLQLVHSSKREREGQGENLFMECSSFKGQAIEEAGAKWWVSYYQTPTLVMRLVITHEG